MKKILHSGQFLDYDGNIIKITFYQEKHLWVSTTSITAPYTGGEYEFEVWSDYGLAMLRDGEDEKFYDGVDANGKPKTWATIEGIKTYTNNEGHTVNKYKVIIKSNGEGVLIGSSRSGKLTIVVKDLYGTNGYDGEPVSKTITITRR
jgi:hypothetical protein